MAKSKTIIVLARDRGARSFFQHQVDHVDTTFNVVCVTGPGDLEDIAGLEVAGVMYLSGWQYMEDAYIVEERCLARVRESS